MSRRVPDLHQAVAAFRREHALSFVSRLSGRLPDPPRARRALTSESLQEALAEAASQHAISSSEHGAIAAHVVRAAVEEVYTRARQQLNGFGVHELTIEGEARMRRLLLAELASAHVARRQAVVRGIDTSLVPLLEALELGIVQADEAAREWFARLDAPRHADAGPEGGNAQLAQKWLEDTRELADEAVAFATKNAATSGSDGGEALWALSGPAYTGLFAREGRMRRLGGDFEALGLRATLNAYARVAPTHDGPFMASQVALVQAPNDVRIASSGFELGIAAELGAAEGVGRALAHVLASPGLPVAQRHGTVGSVARAFGSIAVQRFANPLFLARHRDLRSREASAVARLTAAYLLLDSRMAAAAVLTRGLKGGDDRRARAAELASRALTRVLPESLGTLFVTRLSPGGPFRGKLWGLAIGAVLRENFDEDWFRNPRVAEPLRGAAARAGELSVEAFAAELGAQVEQGKRWLAELF